MIEKIIVGALVVLAGTFVLFRTLKKWREMRRGNVSCRCGRCRKIRRGR